MNRSLRVHDERSAFLLRVHLGLIDQLAERRNQRILAIGAVVRREAHRLLGRVHVGAEAAAQQVVVLVREHVLLEVVELRAHQRHAAGAERRAALGGIRNAQRAAAFDPVIAALALDLEVAGGELQTLIVVGAEVPAGLQEQVLGLRVRRRAAGGEADATTVRVVGDAAVAERAVQHQIVVVRTCT